MEAEVLEALPAFLYEPEWWAVIIAVLALLPQLRNGGRWLWRRWSTRNLPRNTQVHQDRENYGLLLEKYDSYLTLLENLIVLRAQVEAGSDPWTPELEEEFVRVRDGIYQSLEKRSEVEKDMGDLQKLDILEGRMVGITDLRKRREELEERQAEIEAHPLFVRRGTNVE